MGCKMKKVCQDCLKLKQFCLKNLYKDLDIMLEISNKTMFKKKETFDKPVIHYFCSVIFIIMMPAVIDKQ